MALHLLSFLCFVQLTLNTACSPWLVVARLSRLAVDRHSDTCSLRRAVRHRDVWRVWRMAIPVRDHDCKYCRA